MGQPNARILESSDFNLVVEFDSSIDQTMGTAKPIGWSDNFANQLSEYISTENRDKVMVGTFDGDELIATMGMIFWRNMPYWTLVKYQTARKFRNTPYNIQKNGMLSCMRKCIELAEQRECFTWYYCRSLASYFKIIRFLERAEKKYAYENVKRYSRHLDAVVRAGEKPKFHHQWKLMGQKLWDVDLVIAFATLEQCERLEKLGLNEFRDFK